MVKVGITGGIGSGKSVVCRVFSTLGIPVFNADDTARDLVESDASLIKGISALFGPDIYAAGKLDRAKVSSIVFHEPGKLQQLNALVHPATIQYAHDWFARQQAPYVIKEAAIFFESGSYTEMDVMIGVYAPQEVRIQRAMKRNNMSREKVLSIIAQQMDEDEKMKRCKYVIVNDDVSAIVPQVLRIHETLAESA